MKKFAKILTVVLAVCMIVGVMAVSSSAAFAGPSKPSGTTGSIKLQGGVNFGTATKATNCCKITNVSGTIYRFYNDGSLTHSHTGVCGEESNARAFYTGESLINRITANSADYSTVDFSFSSDKYLVNGVLSDQYVDGATLAYTTHFALGMRYNSNHIFGYFVQDTDGNWYVSDDNEWSPEDVALATEINEHNHVTFICSPSRTALYVNGDHIKSLNYGWMVSGSKAGNALAGFFVADQTVENATQFSIVGNPGGSSKGEGRPAIHNYYGGYDSKNNFGIDDCLAMEDYNLNLINCTDSYYYSQYRNSDIAKKDIVTVTYQDYDGNEIITGKYKINRAVNNTKFFEFDNGWYDVNVKTWKLIDGSALETGGSYTLVPDGVEAVAGLDTYKKNISVLDEYKYNLYFKKTEGISDVKVNNIPLNSVILSDGSTYYYVSSESNAFNNISTEFEVTVNYTVTINGTPYELSGNAAVTMQDYISDGLKQYADGSAATKLIINFLNYIEKCYSYEGTPAPEWLTSELAKHTGCKCFRDALPDEKAVADLGLNYEDLSEYRIAYYPVSDGTNGAGVTRAGLAVFVPVDAGEATVTAALTGIVNNRINKPIEVTFTKAEGTHIEDEVEYNVYLSDVTDLAIYNMLETVTLTVNGDTGTFNLAAYVVANPNVELTNALYRFAKAAYDYKTVGFVR